METIPIIPKSTGGGYEGSCIVSAYNAGTGEAYLYVEFKEKIRMTQFFDYMIGMDAAEVSIDTFSAKQSGQKSTYDDECAIALFTVLQKSKEPGWTLVERGTPSVEPKAPAQTSTAEFLAQEREDLIAQETVMREDPGAFQHDGGYAGPILGKQKMAERSESPTSAGAGGSKRQRGSLVGFIKEHQQQWAEAMESAINEEIERMDNEKTAKIDAITAERDSLAAKNAELTARIDGFSAEKAELVNELDGVRKELAAKTNENRRDYLLLVNELDGVRKELVAKTDESRHDYLLLLNKLVETTEEYDKECIANLKNATELRKVSAEKSTLVNELECVKHEMQTRLDEARESSATEKNALVNDFKTKFDELKKANDSLDTDLKLERENYVKTKELLRDAHEAQTRLAVRLNRVESEIRTECVNHLQRTIDQINSVPSDPAAAAPALPSPPPASGMKTHISFADLLILISQPQP